MVRRASRAKVAARSVAFRLTERDHWLLEALAKMRFLGTGQIARLFFGSTWGANKRLRRLFDAGLVRVWLRSLAAENVYSITRAGVRALGAAEGAGASIPRGLDGNLEHLLAINQVRISLALGVPAAGGELLSWRSDWDLRAIGKARIVPDALFVVRWTDAGERAFALELDHHTKSPRRFLAKVLRYAAAAHAGGGIYGMHDPVILVVGSHADWLERYRAAVAHARFKAPIWFATLADVDTTGADHHTIWCAAADARRLSLRDLSLLPCSWEGTGIRTAVAVASCAPQSARLHPSRIEADQWPNDS